MESEADRAQLAADYPGWRIWRNGGLVFAWLLESKPPLRFYRTTVAELRAAIEEYEAKEGDKHGGSGG